MKMKKVSGVSDYFVIASGGSTTQTRAVADHIVQVMKAKGERVRHVEGLREASWVLIDCTDVVAHVFLKDTRRFYDLESLWKKAPLLHWKERDKAPKERFVEPKRKKPQQLSAPKKKKKAKKNIRAKKSTKPNKKIKPKRSRKS